MAARRRGCPSDEHVAHAHFGVRERTAILLAGRISVAQRARDRDVFAIPCLGLSQPAHRGQDLPFVVERDAGDVARVRVERVCDDQLPPYRDRAPHVVECSRKLCQVKQQHAKVLVLPPSIPRRTRSESRAAGGIESSAARDAS